MQRGGKTGEPMLQDVNKPTDWLDSPLETCNCGCATQPPAFFIWTRRTAEAAEPPLNLSTHGYRPSPSVTIAT